MSKPHALVAILLFCLASCGLFAQQQKAPADRQISSRGGRREPAS